MIKTGFLGLVALSNLVDYVTAGKVDVYPNFLNQSELDHFLKAPTDDCECVGCGLSTGYAVLERDTAKRIHSATTSLLLGDNHSCESNECINEDFLNDEGFYDQEDRFRVLQVQQLTSSSCHHRDSYWDMDDGSKADVVQSKVGIIFLETNPEASFVAEDGNDDAAEEGKILVPW